MRCRWLVAGLVWATVGILVASGWTQIPTKEERIRDSALNEEYGTYRAHSIRAYPFVRFPTPEDRKGPMPDACYRYDFQLPAAPRQAMLTVQPGRYSYQVFVNGKQLVAPPPPGIKLPGVQNLDLTPHLRPGDNVIGIQVPNTARDFYGAIAAEGIVFCREGSIVRLMTDNTWKGGWGLPEGWHQPDADLAAFKSVEDLRVINWGAAIYYGYPYYGPIQVAAADGRQPILDEKESVELKITLLNLGAPGKPLATLSYQIFDEFSRKTVGEGTVGLSPKGKLDLTGNLRIGPLPKGAYRVRFFLEVGGEEIDHRDYEVASVGVIEQRLVEGTHYEEGMELKEIWRVDCTQEPEPDQFLACDSGGKEVKTKVVEGPAGKYRTFLENRPLTSFAYKFKVKELYVPHLVVIEWPDDAARGMLAQLYEPTSMISRDQGGYQRSEASVVCIKDHPVRSNQMQKLHFIYWSNEEEAAIHIWNTWGAFPAPAAVSRITVYQILNDLPALRIADAGDRMIGYHTERGPNTATATYYAGPLGPLFSKSLAGRNHPEFYRSWYTTMENMIKRMRFSGQNVYLMGQFMYDGSLYPSGHFNYKHYGGSPGSGVGTDYGAFMLRMFERNGMNMVSGIEYVHTKELLASFPPATLEEVINEGAPTLLTISKTAGVSALHGYKAWGGLNYFHPRVQQDILTIVEELVELYHGYPAWRGISFLLSRNFGPMAPCGRDDPLDYGYEDYTIDLFQKETGIKIPVSAKDPERFGQRYDWLMANAKQKWIDWRCDQYTRLYRKIRDRIIKGRPDLKLYLFNFEPLNFTKQADDLSGHFDDPAFMRQAIKAFGFDPNALSKEPGIVISFGYPAPGTGTTVGAKSRTWWNMLHSQLWNDLFANDGKGGSFIWASIPHVGYTKIPEGKWLFERSAWRQGYFWPKFMTDGFVNAMVRSNPTWMPHTCMDVVESGGRLHELRLFSRAYRSLPNGKYDRLTGNGLDQNIWVERTRAKGAEYAYAANADWWEVDVTLTFAKGAKVHDLIADQPVKLEGGRWSFHLDPFEVRTFRITGAGSAQRSAIRSAQSKIAKESRQGAESIMDEAVQQARKTVARAHASEAEIRDRPGWQGVEILEQMIARIEELKTAGDLARAYELATSWTMERAQQQVVNEALEAMPFLVLGPFGKPEDTNIAKFGPGNPPVVPEYQGMETAYIPETGEIDFTKKYEVYPDKKMGWQQTIKADYLSFYGICHSEMPLWMVAYAYTEIYSPQERDAAIWVGSANAIWVWVNGQRVVKHGGHGTSRGGQRPSEPDQDRGNCHFEKGWNRVLVKAVQRGWARAFFRITDRNGNPLDDLRFRVPKVG